MSSQAPLRVSVIIPAYNAETTLPSCLAALARQDFCPGDYEILVVDDGSTDGTAAAASRSGATQVLACRHCGPATARNAGAAVARGAILLFTDADCEPLPNWMTEMVRPLADPAIAGVKGCYRTRQTAIVARLAQQEFEERYDRLAAWPYIDFVDTYSAALRASAFQAAGGFDPAFPYANNEDVDLSYRLARLGYKLVFNPAAQVYHRHVAAWPDYVRLKLRRGYWRTLVYRRYPGKAVRDSYTPQLLKLQILLLGAGAAALLAALWRPVARPAGAVATASLAGLLLSSVPFTRRVARREPALAPWAPLFIVLRAAAFAAGIAGGLAGMFTFPRRK